MFSLVISYEGIYIMAHYCKGLTYSGQLKADVLLSSRLQPKEFSLA